MNDHPLSGPEIMNLVSEVAQQLDPIGPQLVLVIVGGSLLAWHGLRDTTTDVDSVRRLTAELQEAVQAVALQHDLSPDWLNANAAAFIPNTFNIAECGVLLDHQRLLVLGAPLRDVFVMKMYRGLPNDVADMITMWPRLDFVNAQQVVELFFAAYPHAPDDEYLADFVIDVALGAGFSIS